MKCCGDRKSEAGLSLPTVVFDSRLRWRDGTVSSSNLNGLEKR